MNQGFHASLITYLDHLQDWSKQDEKTLKTPVRAGRWSMRDIIAHIYYWDRFILETVLPASIDQTEIRHWPHAELYNRAAIAALDGRPVTWICKQGIATRSGLLDEMAKRHGTDSLIIHDREDISNLQDVADLFSKHDEHHIRQIQHYLDAGMSR